MNIYIWKNVAKATDSYHDTGGVVVVASDLDRARAIIAEPYCRSLFHGDDGHKCDEDAMVTRVDCDAMTEQPDFVYPLHGDHAESLLIFPDSGCC